MNREDLYREISKLAPYMRGGDDYRDVLLETLKQYIDAVGKLNKAERPEGDWDERKQTIRKICEKIKDIGRNSYKGLPSTAFIQLCNLLDKSLKDSVQWCYIPEDADLWRMRQIDNRRIGIMYSEMFHVPISMRRKINTQRYSTPGYPCLYLGTSIYVCWEEKSRPAMSGCWTSRLKTKNELKLLDMRRPTLESFTNNLEQYLYFYPLIISCMIPVRDNTDVFKPEYLIPQMITEWLIKRSELGVIYTTTHLNADFEYPYDKYDNIAIPIKSPLDNKATVCKELSKMFDITEPANLEIEKLREPFANDGGEYSEPVKDKRQENYELSDFGNLEKRLCDENYYRLKCLN